MAVEQTPDPLERATQALRSDDDNGWIEVSQAVMSRVRTLVTPAVSVATFGPGGDVGRGDRHSAIHVSGRVLTPLIRVAVDTPTRAAESIDLTVVDDRCSGVRIELVCVYGADLQQEGDEVRRIVTTVLTEVLGVDRDFDPDRDIEIEIVDVVQGDPHAE